VVDVRGVRALALLAVAYATAVLAMLALGSGGAPAPALVAVAVLVGALFPPSPSVFRGRIPILLRDAPQLVPAAYALDSAMLQLMFVTAPLLVAATVATVGAAASLVLSAALVLAGAAAFLWALPGHARPGGRRVRDPLGALRSPGIRVLALTMVPVGFGMGALEIALTAFADAEGRLELAGVLLAALALASMTAGLAYGVWSRRPPLPVMQLGLTLALAPALLLPLAAWSIPAMMLLVVPVGLVNAPLVATRNELAGAVALPGTETEALTWPLTALMAGIALGAATAGALAESSGWRAAILAATAGGAAAAALAVARRADLGARPAASPAPPATSIEQGALP
jgi:hypothetical protein